MATERDDLVPLILALPEFGPRLTPGLGSERTTGILKVDVRKVG